MGSSCSSEEHAQSERLRRDVAAPRSRGRRESLAEPPAAIRSEVANRDVCASPLELPGPVPAADGTALFLPSDSPEVVRQFCNGARGASLACRHGQEDECSLASGDNVAPCRGQYTVRPRVAGDASPPPASPRPTPLHQQGDEHPSSPNTPVDPGLRRFRPAATFGPLEGAFLPPPRRPPAPAGRHQQHAFRREQAGDRTGSPGASAGQGASTRSAVRLSSGGHSFATASGFFRTSKTNADSGASPLSLGIVSFD
uniref:Uncharacterized protein n=1 Tax=Neobodo designis TaxID=312471 RepID=A0A6U4URZ5_NEODS|mmetsp:Transcript_41249/g.127381  ORF Transcript_41249/g.127381 Transcript_41249/m.127381 type:complete len:255 (+) Transcript_41249:18-782(+)